MSHCHDEAELVLEDVCGLVTKRLKEFLKLSVQQQCLRCSHWPFAAIWGTERSRDKPARGTWKRTVTLWKQDSWDDWATLQGPFPGSSCRKRLLFSNPLAPLPFSFKLLQLSDLLRVIHFTHWSSPVFNWNALRKGSVGKNTDFAEKVSCLSPGPDT